jgi:hypothetical protein
MSCVRDESKVVYQAKDGKQTKAYDALEWLAAMCTHIPGWGEQMVRYYAPSIQPHQAYSILTEVSCNRFLKATVQRVVM